MPDPAKHREKDLPLPENLWVEEKNAKDPANPTAIPEGLEDEAPMTDAMSAWIRANCKFAKRSLPSV